MVINLNSKQKQKDALNTTCEMGVSLMEAIQKGEELTEECLDNLQSMMDLIKYIYQDIKQNPNSKFVEVINNIAY